MFIKISNNLKKLSKFFPENLYVVGGYVRNQILGVEDGDVDLSSCVDIEEVSKRLENSEFSVKVKSLKCGSLLISNGRESFEYTAFRKEVYEDGGAHVPSVVVGTDKIDEDAVRRDFTVNAIYYCINTDEVVDLYHGIIDIKQKILRTIENPDDVLCHDGERILRLVRLAGELGFDVDKSTFVSAQKFAKNVEEISGARKYNEIEKILYCDKRYCAGLSSLKKALKLLNKLGVWKCLGLDVENVKYKMVYKVEDRFLGLLIDIVDSQKPVCLETFLNGLLKDVFEMNDALSNKIFVYLSGYYNALYGMKNKEYFFKYFEDWANIFSLLGAKSKRIQSKYSFFYQYIIGHGLVILVSDLDLSVEDIRKNFKSIDKRNYDKILQNLLSKVFDGKLKNEKSELLLEIEKNLKNY